MARIVRAHFILVLLGNATVTDVRQRVLREHLERKATLIDPGVGAPPTGAVRGDQLSVTAVR